MKLIPVTVVALKDWLNTYFTGNETHFRNLVAMKLKTTEVF